MAEGRGKGQETREVKQLNPSEYKEKSRVMNESK